MAGATIWKGNIHFEDADVPVKLHTAVREERVQFHLPHCLGMGVHIFVVIPGPNFFHGHLIGQED